MKSTQSTGETEEIGGEGERRGYEQNTLYVCVMKFWNNKKNNVRVQEKITDFSGWETLLCHDYFFVE